MQLEECKAAGGESELNRFVLLVANMGGASCTPRPIAPGRQEPIHGTGKGTGIYWESSQGTGGSQWQSGALAGEAAAQISALPHSECGVLRAGTGLALPPAGVDASAWAQPQRGGLKLSRVGGGGGLKHLRAGCPGGV